MKISKARQEECRERLQSLIKPGDTVYCVLRHVSRSGMMRVIDLHIIKDGEPVWIGRTVADFLGYSYKDNGLRVTGCGMDMGFAVVYELSHKLFPDGFGCIGKNCPSNDHSNGDRDYTPGHPHTSGGYALKHRWI
jgi:hypothetical protein